MKIISRVIITACIFFSCKSSNKELKQQLIMADSMSVNYFKGDGTMDTVVQVRMIKDRNTLTQLNDFITADVVEEKNNCGYDGSLHFFKNNVVIMDVYFRMNNDDCSQFTYSFNRQKSAGKLSGAARKILQQIKQ